MGLTESLLVKIHAIDGVTPVLGGVGTKAGIFGGKMAAAGVVAGAALIGVGVAAVKMAAEFDSKMREVWTLTDISEEAFEDMKLSVRDMAKEIPKSTEDLAEGLYQVISAGFDGADAMHVLETSAMAAVGGMTDTETAVDAVTTALNAYGKGAEEAEDVADSMFQAVVDGKITFEEIASGMAKATSVGATLGVEFSELMAITATLTKAGVASETAFMSERAIMMAMLKPTGELAELVGDLGHESAVSMVQSEGLTGTLNKLWEAVGEDVEKFAELIPNVRALGSAMIMVGPMAKELEQNLQNQADRAGISKEAYLKMVETLESQLIIAWSNLKDILLEVGGAILPKVTAALQMLNDSWDELATIISPIVWLLQGTFKGIVEVVTSVVLFFQNSVYMIQDAWSGIVGFFQGLWNSVASTFWEGVAFAQEGIAGLFDMASHLPFVGGKFAELRDSVFDSMVSSKAKMAEFDHAGDVMSGKAEAYTIATFEAFNKMGSGVKSVFVSMYDKLVRTQDMNNDAIKRGAEVGMRGIISTIVGMMPIAVGNQAELMKGLTGAVASADFKSPTAEKIHNMAAEIAGMSGVPLAQVEEILNKMVETVGGTILETQPIKTSVNQASLSNALANIQASVAAANIVATIRSVQAGGGAPAGDGGSAGIGAPTGGFTRTIVTPAPAVVGGGITVNISAGAFSGTPGEARRFGSWVAKIIQEEGKR